MERTCVLLKIVQFLSTDVGNLVYKLLLCRLLADLPTSSRYTPRMRELTLHAANLRSQALTSCLAHQRSNRSLTQEEKPEKLPPHIYALVDETYAQVLESWMSQSILISGESGAGKTEGNVPSNGTDEVKVREDTFYDNCHTGNDKSSNDSTDAKDIEANNFRMTKDQYRQKYTSRLKALRHVETSSRH